MNSVLGARNEKLKEMKTPLSENVLKYFLSEKTFMECFADLLQNQPLKSIPAIDLRTVSLKAVFVSGRKYARITNERRTEQNLFPLTLVIVTKGNRPSRWGNAQYYSFFC